VVAHEIAHALLAHKKSLQAVGTIEDEADARDKVGIPQSPVADPVIL